MEWRSKLKTGCADWTEQREAWKKIEELELATSDSKSAIDESKKFYGKVMKLDIAKNTITIESSRDIKPLKRLDTFEMKLLGI